MDFHPKKGLSNTCVVFLILLILILALAITLGAQYYIELDRISIVNKGANVKDIYEISKIDAEIRQIRSDTGGSLFALKVIALFITVGGAVGGYLIGLSRTTQARINFEDRKNIDEIYQSIIQELSSESTILRAAAAVKLGSILKSFPTEWNVSRARMAQLMQLTKQVLAAALSIEEDKKVLKTLTINLVLHKDNSADTFTNVKSIDLSGARAQFAYWSCCDFSDVDFYAADLDSTSFRKSRLIGAQFRESKAKLAVFDEADCTNANFNFADLRGASFAKTVLNGTNFEGARVCSASLLGAIVSNLPSGSVDVSKNGDGSKMIPIAEWLMATGAILQ